MSETVAAPIHLGYGSGSYRAYVLGALLVIYTFNVIDRILVGLLQEKIKEDLHISDFQLGLLGGPAFVLIYTLLGIPIARYAERANRITIVAIGCAVWSAATAACGFAQNYLQLLLARMWVGIGEAACIPSSHSLIADYFPGNRRASALAIYTLGIPIGTILAAVGGGWMVQNLDWRAAFSLLGVPGVVAALLFKLTVKETPRATAAAQTPGLGATFKTLLSKASFRHMVIGGALMALFGFSSSQFLVSYFVRSYALTVSTAAFAFAAIAGIAIAIGTFLGGFLCDRLVHRHPRVMSWLPTLGVAVAVPLYLLAFVQSSFSAAFAFLMVAPIFHYFYLAPLFAVTQSVAEPWMRATASALMLLIVTLVGYGVGPPFVGAVADYVAADRLAEIGLTAKACAVAVRSEGCVTASAYGLRIGLMSVLIFMAWAGVHFWFAGRSMARDRVG